MAFKAYKGAPLMDEAKEIPGCPDLSEKIIAIPIVGAQYPLFWVRGEGTETVNWESGLRSGQAPEKKRKSPTSLACQSSCRLTRPQRTGGAGGRKTDQIGNQGGSKKRLRLGSLTSPGR